MTLNEMLPPDLALCPGLVSTNDKSYLHCIPWKDSWLAQKLHHPMDEYTMSCYVSLSRPIDWHLYICESQNSQTMLILEIWSALSKRVRYATRFHLRPSYLRVINCKNLPGRVINSHSRVYSITEPHLSDRRHDIEHDARHSYRQRGFEDRWQVLDQPHVVFRSYASVVGHFVESLVGCVGKGYDELFEFIFVRFLGLSWKKITIRSKGDMRRSWT